MTLVVRQDRHLIRPAYRSNRFVLAEITAPPSHREDHRPAVNLAFVLDRSGSMGGGKFELARAAVRESIDRLHDDDRFAIVVYDERIDVVVPTTHATVDTRRNAIHRLGEIQPRGSTNLGEGWLRGCEQVALALAPDGVNRCLLLTDGLANVGITDRDELGRHAAELRVRGVSTSTFGVGDDFDEQLLQAMASAGGGHFYYIADATSIRDHITSEVGETLDVVARDVRLDVAAPGGVRVESLSPFATQAVGGRTEIILGDLTSDEKVSVVLRLNFNYGEVGRTTGVLLGLRDRDGAMTESGRRLDWEYATDRDNDFQPREVDVDRAVARVFAARARQTAVGLNRAGDYGAARETLRATAKKIRRYAGSDPELRAILTGLEGEATVMSAPMLEMDRKVAYAASSYAMRARTADGRAMKKGPEPGR